ncbi:hypothetical protein QZM35_22760 [Burkholderia sp. AU45274]|uniref:hypothetical protein n=1 Tax=Burkholderia sp. AU45274 TaxID=3059205 RepID=UPI00264EFA2E|nr:hypothetical protein [Burkholderia sp. AU45274]MDN7490536.1 hypothetical protein [Burkholderia sp. AU45274]
MTDQYSGAAVRVCAIADIECSRNCGTGACEREARYSVEQHEAAPAGVDALTDQQLIDMWSAGNRAILNGAGSRSAATAMRVAVGTSAAPLEGTGNGAAFMDIVFDGPPSYQSGRFVEVEDEQGRSFNAGQWIDRGNGLWALRIARAPRTEVAGAVPSVDQICAIGALTSLGEAMGHEIITKHARDFLAACARDRNGHQQT